jgi:protein O-GlcNAc transferase
MPGTRSRGRSAVLRTGRATLGLGELVAATAESYVEIALALAGDLARLERLRQSLRLRFEQSPLRDERRCAARFEELLRTAWQQYRAHWSIRC